MIRLILFPLLLTIFQVTYGQNGSVSISPKSVQKEWIVSSLLDDQIKILTSPFNLKKTYLKFVIPVVSLTAISIIFDEQIYKSFRSFRSQKKWIGDFSSAITYMGDDRTSLSVSSVFLMGGLLTKNEHAIQTALMGYQTFVHSGLVIQILKHSFSRQRPSEENGKDHWNGPLAAFRRYRKNDSWSKYDAFPSGHTIVAWGMATIIAKQYSQHKWISVAAYSLATFAGLSRVTEKAHWFSDVIIGGALGYSIGTFIYKTHTNTKWSLTPNFGKNHQSINLTYKL